MSDYNNHNTSGKAEGDGSDVPSNDQIRRYLRGTMTAEEEQWMDQKIADNPFYADAVAGFRANADEERHQSALDRLNKHVDAKTGNTPKHIALQQKNTRGWYLGIAASVLILVTAGLTIFLVRKPESTEKSSEEKNIAYKQQEKDNTTSKREKSEPRGESSTKRHGETATSQEKKDQTDEEKQTINAEPEKKKEQKQIAAESKPLKETKKDQQPSYAPPAPSSPEKAETNAFSESGKTKAAYKESIENLLAIAEEQRSDEQRPKKIRESKKIQKRNESARTLKKEDCPTCSTSADTMFEEADRLILAGEPQEAVTVLNKLLNNEKYKQYHNIARLYRSAAFLKAGQRQKALNDLRKIPKSDSMDISGIIKKLEDK